MKYIKEIEINIGDAVTVITPDGELTAVVKEAHHDSILVYIHEYGTTRSVSPAEIR